MKCRENLALKVLAFFGAVVTFAAAAVMGWYQAANYDVIWGEGTPATGYTINYLQWQDHGDLRYLLSLYARESRGEKLDTTETQTKAELESAFSADSTNLRWQLRDSAGNIRFGNTQEDIPVPAEGLWSDSYQWEKEEVGIDVIQSDWAAESQGAVNAADPEKVVSADWREELVMTAEQYREGEITLSEGELDAVYMDEDGSTEILVVTDSQGRHVYGPTVRAYLSANEYGYQYQCDWSWTQTQSSSAVENLELVMWLATGYPVADAYQRAYFTLRNWEANREVLLAVTLACVVSGLLLTAFLCAGAGHKRGTAGIWLHWFHRIPGDLLLALVILGLVLTGFSAVEWVLYRYYSGQSMTEQLLSTGALAACGAVLGLTWVVTFAARCKAHTLWRNTLIWKFCHLVYRLCRRTIAAIPLVWKTVVVGLAYMLFTVLTFRSTAGLWLLGTAAVIVGLCLWSWQWKRIRRGTKAIIGGNPEAHIETRKMFPDLKAHADELNNLGQAISAAVDERLKSERFKAELITNVSHDLKTPLTSIINYVDLLKKQDISDPTAREYIEVLERKSQRLKKLTEDLVEASKASTGALTVNRERLDVVQLVRQAAGEYEERLSAAGLTLVQTLPEEPVYIDADGRHVWRVLDNLLGNCAKYALEGTRVYLDAAAEGGNAVLTVKNISRQSLNIPAERLVERFVRGDESRTTEGSGLGLSIARSLTELQGGQFSLSIDGDLFKARVTFPLAPETK